MYFYIDSANINKVAEIFGHYPVSGITTNPTILSREKDFISEHGGMTALLQKIRGIIGPEKPIFYQLTQAGEYALLENGGNAESAITLDGALRVIDTLCDKVGGKFVFKIAAYREGYEPGGGFALMEELSSREGIVTAATAVFTPGQAMLASEAGARYVAPFVNRLTKAGGDGIGLVRDILSVLSHSNTEVLAASLGSVEQITALAALGVQNITLPPELFDGLAAHPMADDAVNKFIAAASTIN